MKKSKYSYTLYDIAHMNWAEAPTLSKLNKGLQEYFDKGWIQWAPVTIVDGNYCVMIVKYKEHESV